MPLEISDAYADMLKHLLQKADKFAEENVKRGDGGPFGASLHVFNAGRDAKRRDIGTPAANAVLKKGQASAHAENEALSPENIDELRAVLAQCGAGTTVVLASSGESCPACHAKEEILARTLQAEGLIQGADQFLVIYGATFEQTRTVAGFNDEPYLWDMQKTPDQRHVKTTQAPVADIPEAVAGIFAAAETPVAVVVRDDEVIGFGFADRGNDLMATAEVGPLAYAECLWANVGRFVTVNHPRQAAFATQEAPGIGNRDLFEIVSRRPYNGPGSAIHVADFSNGFENRAQLAWREKMEAERRVTGRTKSLYNGAAPG